MTTQRTDWKSPCVLCGYNGPGFFQPETHPCAEWETERDALLGEIDRMNRVTDAVKRDLRAALAEPVADYEALYRTNVRCECGDDDACRLARQRDEARAEVERLRQIVSACASAVGNGSFAAPACSLEFMSGIPAEIAAETKRGREAYQRGAEAMREAAASCVGSDTALLQTYRSVLEGRIRAMPVPEDKL